MGIFSRAKNSSTFDWTNLDEVTQLDELIQSSYEQPVLLFKHSTRCSISSMVKRRIENEWSIESDKITTVYLDLLQHRNISTAIAEKTGVKHQSPQAILLRNGTVVYHASHTAISVNDIKKLVE